MHLYSLNYNEYPKNKANNSWSASNFFFSQFNLLVGKNTTGKTRTIFLIKNLAAIIKSQKVKLKEATWEVEFKQSFSDEKAFFKYHLEIHDNEVIKEMLWINEEEKVSRKKGKAVKIYSENAKDFITISPPNNKLILQVRRDEVEFPYFEPLVKWAEQLYSFTFATRATEIKTPLNEGTIDEMIDGLEIAPSIFQKLNASQKKQLIRELKEVGYDIKNVKAIQKELTPAKFTLVEFLEEGLHHPFEQPQASQGMYRTFALLTIITYFHKKSQSATILIDDLCEGLDYERSTQLTKLLLSKVKKSKMQLISTTNDEFLMNEVPIEYWNVLKRTKGTLKAFNIQNSTEVFEGIKLTGLSNFNAFTSNIMNKLK